MVSNTYFLYEFHGLWYKIIDSPTNTFFFNVELNENITCHLLECGVGVFVIENLDIADLSQINTKFNMHFECELYYEKKIEQKAIKDQLGDFQVINYFMNDVWKSVDKRIRPYSASENYKYNGLSYT